MERSTQGDDGYDSDEGRSTNRLENRKRKFPKEEVGEQPKGMEEDDGSNSSTQSYECMGPPDLAELNRVYPPNDVSNYGMRLEKSAAHLKLLYSKDLRDVRFEKMAILKMTYASEIVQPTPERASPPMADSTGEVNIKAPVHPSDSPQLLPQARDGAFQWIPSSRYQPVDWNRTLDYRPAIIDYYDLYGCSRNQTGNRTGTGNTGEQIADADSTVQLESDPTPMEQDGLVENSSILVRVLNSTCVVPQTYNAPGDANADGMPTGNAQL